MDAEAKNGITTRPTLRAKSLIGRRRALGACDEQKAIGPAEVRAVGGIAKVCAPCIGKITLKL